MYKLNSLQNFHASRGGSGALYPQSAIVGVMPALRFWFVFGLTLEWALKVESCAIKACEPCQVRKEAALSNHFCVPQGCLARAFEQFNA